MRTAKNNNVLTTGQVAKICHVSPRTVSKWFDSGKLRGYVIPGSKDRRIPFEQLTAFMQAHEIPLNSLDGGTCRIVVLDETFSQELSDQVNDSHKYSLTCASSEFQAGAMITQTRPHAVIVGCDRIEKTINLCREIRQCEAGDSIGLIAITDDNDDFKNRSLIKAGADQYLTRPIDLDKLIRSIESATDIF